MMEKMKNMMRGKEEREEKLCKGIERTSFQRECEAQTLLPSRDREKSVYRRDERTRMKKRMRMKSKLKRKQRREENIFSSYLETL